MFVWLVGYFSLFVRLIVHMFVCLCVGWCLFRLFVCFVSVISVICFLFFIVVIHMCVEDGALFVCLFVIGVFGCFDFWIFYDYS